MIFIILGSFNMRFYTFLGTENYCDVRNICVNRSSSYCIVIVFLKIYISKILLNFCFIIFTFWQFTTKAITTKNTVY